MLMRSTLRERSCNRELRPSRVRRPRLAGSQAASAGRIVPTLVISTRHVWSCSPELRRRRQRRQRFAQREAATTKRIGAMTASMMRSTWLTRSREREHLRRSRLLLFLRGWLPLLRGSCSC